MDDIVNKKDIEAITDSAWRRGFEAGLHVAKDSSESSKLLEELISRLSTLSDMVDKDLDDEIDVEVEIGDIVELTEGEFYIVCKIDGEDLVAIDPRHHRLVSGKLSDVISIGKIDLDHISTDS